MFTLHHTSVRDNKLQETRDKMIRMLCMGCAIILLVPSAMQVVSAYEWSRELLNGSEVIRCAGEDVIFPWELKLNDSIEEFVGISWFQHKVGKDEIIIANYFNSDKRFTPSQSSVSQRLSQVKTQGIRISNLMLEDTAVYRVSVSLDPGGDVFQSVQLIVAEKPETEMGELKVSENVTVASKHQMKCGKFIRLGYPPVSVVWKDPSGKEYESAGYQDGFFYLELPSHHSGGEYSCEVRSSSPALKCLTADSSLKEKTVLQVESNNENAGLNIGLVVGIIAGLVSIVILILIFILVIKWKKAKNCESGNLEENIATKEPMV